MTQQILDIGNVANDGTGDTLRVAMNKVNGNFTEIYTTSVVSSGIITTTTLNGNIVLTPDGTGNVVLSAPTAVTGAITSTSDISSGGLSLVGNSLITLTTNADLILNPDGTGTLDIALTASAAGVPGNFSAAEFLTIKVNGVTKYIPLATSTW